MFVNNNALNMKLRIRANLRSFGVGPWHGHITVWCDKIRFNICHIEPHKYINLKTNDWQFHIRSLRVIYLCIIINIGTKYIIR